MEKKIRGTKTKQQTQTKQNNKQTKTPTTGSTDFSAAPNTLETIKAHSHAAIAHFSRLIVNTAAAVTPVGRH